MPTLYVKTGTHYRPVTRDEVIDAAFRFAVRDAAPSGPISGPRDAVAAFPRLIGARESEAFYAVWLNTANRVLGVEQLFTGTIAGCSVYPREVVKAALAANAASVIFAHNHPSGQLVASAADITITERLKAALALVDIAVRDHFVITSEGAYSLAEHGQL